MDSKSDEIQHIFYDFPESEIRRILKIWWCAIQNKFK